MPWYHMTGQDQDVVLYTDVRLARNLQNYPFTHRLDAAGAREIIAAVGGVLEDNGFCKTDFADISRAEAYSLVERQYASLSFVKKSLPHVLYLNEPCSMSAMLCEEDHVNLQCILAGRASAEAYASVSRVEGQLDERLNMAFSEGCGYLSSVPMNVGTGLRVSFLLCLPAMVSAGRIGELTEDLLRMGIALRAVREESGHPTGSLFHLSYRPTGGMSEEDALAWAEALLLTIVSEERGLRNAGDRSATDYRTDRIMRAVGTLRYATLLGTPELMDLLAEVRLGICTGILSDIRMETLTALLIEALPATLSMATEPIPATPHARAQARAVCVRERLFADTTA